MSPHFAVFLTVFLAVGSLAAVRGLAALSVQPALCLMLHACLPAGCVLTASTLDLRTAS